MIKIPTSKKGLAWSIAIAGFFSLCIVLLTVCTDKDLTALSVVASAAWAEASAYSALYLNKSKMENRYKYCYKWVDEMADKYGIENVTDLAKSIIED